MNCIFLFLYYLGFGRRAEAIAMKIEGLSEEIVILNKIGKRIF